MQWNTKKKESENNSQVNFNGAFWQHDIFGLSEGQCMVECFGDLCYKVTRQVVINSSKFYENIDVEF